MTLNDVTVLLADEDPAGLALAAGALRAAGLRVEVVVDGARALEALEQCAVDVLVASESLPDYSGTRLVRAVADRSPDLPVILLSSGSGVSGVVEAVKAGAADCVGKPVDGEELVFTVKKALAAVEAAVDEPPPSMVMSANGNIVGASKAMRNVFSMIERAARSDSTVLVRGETGSGKELVARRVHDLSARKDGPFVKVHCAALPDHLLESELFGYEKGAFTGAASRKAGRVELANGGTLFLDEIGDISAATQVKLLRVLQDRQYERLGGTATLDADVRFVTATHQDLEAMVKAGKFREDLYYRLNVIPILVPPLRKRPEDVAALATLFCKTIGAANRRPSMTLEPEALDLMRRYRWPGNVRQLQNIVERLVVLTDGETISLWDVKQELSRLETGVDLSALSMRSPDLPLESTAIQLDEAVKKAERRALDKALRRAGGNRTLAARILGVSRRTLYNKLQEHGIS